MAAGLLLAGLPAAAHAQSQADSVAASRKVYFDGNPLDPTRFAPPQYGTPPGSGASKTGFDSTGARGKRIRKRARMVATAPPPVSALSDTAAPSTYLRPQPRPAAVIATPAAPSTPLPTYTYEDGTVVRPNGAVARIVPRRRVVEPVIDPFDPLGLRMGAFIVKPALELSAGYDTNPARTPAGTGSPTMLVAPELLAKSDWERHELTASLRGSYTTYPDMSSFNRPSLDSKVNARVDVTSQTRLDLEGRAQVATDTPGDPNFPTGVSEPPTYTTIGGTGGIAHRFNRLELSAKGSVDRLQYESSTLNNGDILDNTDLNYLQVGSALRGSYEIGPGVKPFVEIAFDQRDHDRERDSSGIARNSHGVLPRVGTTFELSRLLTGEIAVGYLTRRYEDPSLEDLRGVTFDASLIWNATALTRASLVAKTTTDESRTPGISGILKRDAALQVDHAFRQWLILSGRAAAGLDTYQGSDREDHRYALSALLTYKMNRNVWAKGELRQEWFQTNAPDSNYMATVFLLGLRFQY